MNEGFPMVIPEPEVRPLRYGFKANVAMTKMEQGAGYTLKATARPSKTVWENRMERDEISASLDELRIKPIWRDPRRFLDVREADMRKPTANLYQISSAPSMYISRHLKMTLIALWRRSLQRGKISQKQYASVTKLRD